MNFPYDYKSLTEELLFKRYCEGDVAAFDALLERLQGLAYSMILRYVKNDALADEIFQEVFYKVCKNKDQFREAVSFKSWLVTICRNTCIDYTRKQSREFKTTSLDGGMEDEGRSLAEQIAADAPSPLEEVSFKIEDAHVAELLDNLPAEQRDTFYQKVVMEMTFEEIGAAMGCSANTAKSRYRYALVALRSLVKRKRLLSKAAS